jgi:hypothetical protein
MNDGTSCAGTRQNLSRRANPIPVAAQRTNVNLLLALRQYDRLEVRANDPRRYPGSNPIGSNTAFNVREPSGLRGR